MAETLSREELIELVRRIMNAEGTEEELDTWEETLEQNVTDPAVSDYIFYPDRDMTAEEIVDRALSYKPIQLPDT